MNLAIIPVCFWSASTIPSGWSEALLDSADGEGWLRALRGMGHRQEGFRSETWQWYGQARYACTEVKWLL